MLTSKVVLDPEMWKGRQTNTSNSAFHSQEIVYKLPSASDSSFHSQESFIDYFFMPSITGLCHSLGQFFLTWAVRRDGWRIIAAP